MRPSQTNLGSAWIEQFKTDSQPIAQLLIDSLEIHDQTNVITTIIDRVRSLVIEAGESAPAVVLPIRSMEDLPDVPETHDNHVAYETYNPGSSFPPLPGSEAEMGGAIRTLMQRNPELFLSPESTLAELRENKVRSIILVTDYSGSGKQALNFARSFTQNSTIASWISYNRTRIYVVTYAASLEASDLLRKEKHFNFSTHTIAKSASSADWSGAQRDAIIDFCRKEASNSNAKHALGYKASFGLYLTNLRVPNNLPHVLIRTEPGLGLFPGREMPASLFRELPTYIPEPSLDRLLRNLGAEDLADLLQDTTRPVRALRSLAILQLADYNIEQNQIDAMLGLSESSLRQLKTSLIALGCLSLEGQITARGRRELSRARSAGRSWITRRAKYVPTGAVTYTPYQLR